MKNYKIYGDEHTKLNLSQKAEKAYIESDSDRIVERDVDGKLIYEIYNGSMGRNRLVRDNMTASEVDKFYCDLADELAENDLAYLKQGILDEIESSLTPEEAEAAGYLTVNTARNGREVVWYFDGINQLAYYIDNSDKLTDEEIDEQLM